MMPLLIEDVRSAMTPSGAFRSWAHLPTGPVADENAFATALILEQLHRLGIGPMLEDIRDRAITFLLTCERPRGSGRFGFYPAGTQPDWIRDPLPPDTDDTALCSLALFQAGRWPRERLRRQVCEVLAPYRLSRRPAGVNWLRPGIYPTWMDGRRLRNPIDICVNLNILTLTRAAGLDQAQGTGMIDMIRAALDWAGPSPERARQVMPYYPHPAELVQALVRAVSHDVEGARELLRIVRTKPWATYETEPDTPICGSLGGGLIWTCPLLQRLRRHDGSDGAGRWMGHGCRESAWLSGPRAPARKAHENR